MSLILFSENKIKATRKEIQIGIHPYEILLSEKKLSLNNMV